MLFGATTPLDIGAIGILVGSNPFLLGADKDIPEIFGVSLLEYLFAYHVRAYTNEIREDLPNWMGFEF